MHARSRSHVSTRRPRSEAVDDPRREVLRVRVSADERERAEHLAAAACVGVSEFVRRLLDDEWKEHAIEERATWLRDLACIQDES